MTTHAILESLLAQQTQCLNARKGPRDYCLHNCQRCQRCRQYRQRTGQTL